MVNCFAGDDPIACRDYVRQRLGLPEWEPPKDDRQKRKIPTPKVAASDRMWIEQKANERLPMTEDEIRNRDLAVQIWNEARDPRGTLAETYLRQHRALDLPDDLAGRVLRFHPRCLRRNENTGRYDPLPTLVVPFRSIDTDDITAIHRVFLNPDGSKIDRQMLGPRRRAAIKLYDDDKGTLCVGEGIETGLAARQLGLEGSVWALGSAGAITFFPVVPGFTALTLLTEKDKTNAEAIRICGTRWKRAGRKVRTARSTVGSDLNDALMQGAL